MTTTIEMDPEEVEFLTQHTNQPDAESALREVANEFIRTRKRRNLVEFREAIDFDEAEFRKAEQEELRD